MVDPQESYIRRSVEKLKRFRDDFRMVHYATDWSNSEKPTWEPWGFFVWPRQAFNVNWKIKNEKNKLLLFSEKRIYIVDFDVEIGVFEDKQYDKE